MSWYRSLQQAWRCRSRLLETQFSGQGTTTPYHIYDKHKSGSKEREATTNERRGNQMKQWTVVASARRQGRAVRKIKSWRRPKDCLTSVLWIEYQLHMCIVWPVAKILYRYVTILLLWIKLYPKPKRSLRIWLAYCYLLGLIFWCHPSPQHIPFSSTHLHLQCHAQVPPKVQHSSWRWWWWLLQQ